MVLSSGTRLGPYEILSPLGKGGMGEVYLARDPRLDREVAIKVLPRALAENAEALDRFEREAKAVAALSHPNILAIHDFGLEAGMPFAVVEYLEGETLRQRLDSSPLPWREALRIGAAISDGLSATHSRGVIHRDLKPENVFLTVDGRVKILDFGLAKREPPAGTGAEASPTTAINTQPGTILGTIGYMSPEHVRGVPALATTDIFSLGCILYEMLAGRPPFRRSTPADTLSAVLNEQPEQLSREGRDIPTEFERLIARCLEKTAAARFESARDLAAALRNVGSTAPQDFVTTRRSEAHSIAVLPFADMSPQRDQDYLCEGIAEEIITALTKVAELRVAARTSAFAFKRTAHDIREIGRKLNVDTLLEGSVRKSGDRLRITTQLVAVRDGYQLWSERYERRLEDVFAVQDEIAMSIVERLRGSLVRGAGQLVRKATEDPRAYAHYLRGRYHWNRQTGDDLRKAIDYFERALAADPHYAAAHAGLADTYNLLVNWGAVPPQELMKARAAAVRAVQLDDSLAAPHSALGVMASLSGDWKRAEQEHRRAQELNPGDANVYMLSAMSFLAPVGRIEDAIASMERSRELDPVSPFIAVCMAWALYVARRYDPALEECRRALELEPRFALSYWTKGLIETEIDELLAAIASLERARELSSDAPFVLGDLGRAYAIAGRRGDARQILSDLAALSHARYVSPLNSAVVRIGLGDYDEAFRGLEKACAERGEQIYWLNVSPRFEVLRSDPRFDACLRRLGFTTSTN